jgi:predicted DNA-binding transcriptional regulator YafY
MARSTKAAKARRLNAAHRLLEGKAELSEAAQSLSREFGLSRRQAYRYLDQAGALSQPVPVEEASIPLTLKLPPSAVRLLRSYASQSGLTLGEIVTRALTAFLSGLRRHG